MLDRWPYQHHPFSSLFKGDQSALKSCLCLTKIDKTDNNTAQVYIENGIAETLAHHKPFKSPITFPGAMAPFITPEGVLTARSARILERTVSQRYCSTIFLDIAR
jgi:hypothetical protein